MTCVNQFIVENKNNITEFIENLGDQSVPVSLILFSSFLAFQFVSFQLSNNRPASLYGLESDITRDLASLYQFCKEHLQDLQIMSNKEVSDMMFLVRRLIKCYILGLPEAAFRYYSIIK